MGVRGICALLGRARLPALTASMLLIGTVEQSYVNFARAQVCVVTTPYIGLDFQTFSYERILQTIRYQRLRKIALCCAFRVARGP